jgi:hypothetical protein
MLAARRLANARLEEVPASHGRLPTGKPRRVGTAADKSHSRRRCSGRGRGDSAGCPRAGGRFLFFRRGRGADSGSSGTRAHAEKCRQAQNFGEPLAMPAECRGSQANGARGTMGFRRYRRPRGGRCGSTVSMFSLFPCFSLPVPAPRRPQRRPGFRFCHFCPRSVPQIP